MRLWNVQFQDPWFLLGLILVPLYVYWLYKSKNKQGFAIEMPALDMIPSVQTWKVLLLKTMPWIKSLGWIALILAMARPQYTFQKQTINSEGIDIVIAIDLSLSMLAKDFKPDRLSVAKEVISDFIQQRSGDRIGLTAFAGEGYTACPPTLDHKVIIQFIEGLEYGQIQDGTAIGMGLSTSINRLVESKAKSKIVILVTDGSNNTGMVDPIEAADMAQTLGIKVYTIGVGTNGVAPMPVFTFKGMQYRNSRVEIDERLLTDIANRTGGVYFRATNEQELAQIYDNINELEKSKFDSTVIAKHEDKYFLFAVLGFFLWTLFFILKITLFKNIQNI